MNSFDRQISAAEKDLNAFAHEGWSAPPAHHAAADRMHALLVTRADALMRCTENSVEEAELVELADAIEAYEAARWPDAKMVGGKG
jgi:hypothetical protein